MTRPHLLALCLLFAGISLACGTADGKGGGGAGGDAGSGGAGGLGGAAGAGGTAGSGGGGGREVQGAVLTLAGISFDAYVGAFVGAAATDASGAIVATDSTHVQPDGSFELVFEVEPGPSFGIRYFADANRNGVCDRSTEADADGIWLASIGDVEDDTTVGLRFGESTIENPAADACDGLPSDTSSR